jgi:hypothetical protein
MRARAALGCGLVSVALAAIAVAGCSSVLGLDPPTLDPCADTVCPDAAGDVTVEAGVDSSDAGPTPDVLPGGDAADGGDAHAEAACVWDGALPDAGNAGVRCGGGCYPVTICAAGQICCQTTSDAGVTAYACATSESACSGYGIDCVNENDCAGSDVCCHYASSHTVCASSCPTDEYTACIPGSTQDCPTGKACDVRLVNAGVAAPYYGCEM